jgi:hypothetical protein
MIETRKRGKENIYKAIQRGAGKKNKGNGGDDDVDVDGGGRKVDGV